MACGPIPLTPQTISTVMTLMGQPAGLPADLSLVMNGAQPELKIEVTCENARPTGFTLERYFDTKTAITRVVPLDDGEVDEQTSYIMTAADGRIADRVIVQLDGEYKLASVSTEVLCSGNNPNANVCTRHIPTVQALPFASPQGPQPSLMQAFVPEIEAGGEYVFVSAEDYPKARKEAEGKKKAAEAPAPSASVSATVPLPLPLPLPMPVPAPSAAPVASVAPPSKVDRSEKGNDSGDDFKWYHGVLIGLGLLGAREAYARYKKGK